MKPCPKNRKLIALLALPPGDDFDRSFGEAISNDFPDNTLEELTAHIKGCPGCRQYFNELSAVTTLLESTKEQVHLEASESFHRRVANAISAHQRPTPRFNVGDWLSTIGYRLIGLCEDAMSGVAGLIELRCRALRIAVPVLVAIAAASLVVLKSSHPPVASSPKPSPTLSAQVASPKPRLQPTLANYQAVANRSLDRFDRLLTSEGKTSPPPVPIYTASLLRSSSMPE